MSAIDGEHVIHAQLEVEGCTAELYLNDIPITRLGPHTMPIESIAVQQYLVAGVNRVEVLVEPGPTPSRARTAARDLTLEGARATGRLVRFEGGMVADAEFGEILAEVTYRFGEANTRVETFPRSVFAEKDLGAVPRWSFQDAPVLSIDEALVDEAHAVLEAVAGAFRRGSSQELLVLLDDQVRDVVRAYPVMTEEYVKEDLAKVVAHYHRSGDPIFSLARDRHDFRLAAGGRLLHCVDDDWVSSLQLRDPDEGTMARYPIFLARIGGRLRVVR